MQGARQVREPTPGRAPDLPAAALARRCWRGGCAGAATDTAEQVAARLRDRRAASSRRSSEFDYAVVNDELERCVANVQAIIAAERAGATAALRRALRARRSAAQPLRGEPS